MHHMTATQTHTHVNVCFFFQWGAGAAGLHGDSARPRWKEENEASGGDKTSEGVGGWRSCMCRQGGEWKKGGRRRSEGGDDGGRRGSVLSSQSRTQATITQKHSSVQRIQQHQQRHHRLTRTRKTAPLPASQFHSTQWWNKCNLSAKIHAIRW